MADTMLKRRAHGLLKGPVVTSFCEQCDVMLSDDIILCATFFVQGDVLLSDDISLCAV